MLFADEGGKRRATRLTYAIVVRNEVTGETVTVVVSSRSTPDAQSAALVTVFKRYGWRKAVTLLPTHEPCFEPASIDAIS